MHIKYEVVKIITMALLIGTKTLHTIIFYRVLMTNVFGESEWLKTDVRNGIKNITGNKTLFFECVYFKVFKS